MAKHDTWVELIKAHPFETIEDLFPEGFPMRDPFPMGTSKERDRYGQQVKLWHMDMQRLSDDQITAIAKIFAEKFKVSEELVLAHASIYGFAIDHKWVKSMSGGAENYWRTLELANFLEVYPHPSPENLASFIRQQTEDWIDGDRIPDPLPEKYEDVDERLKHDDLENAYQTIDFRKFVEAKDYSIVDVITGKALQDYLEQCN